MSVEDFAFGFFATVGVFLQQYVIPLIRLIIGGVSSVPFLVVLFVVPLLFAVISLLRRLMR